MDLRQNQITVGELLQNPRARAVFQRRFGKWMKHPMVQAAHSLTLAQLSEMAAVYLPKKTMGGDLLCPWRQSRQNATGDAADGLRLRFAPPRSIGPLSPDPKYGGYPLK